MTRTEQAKKYDRKATAYGYRIGETVENIVELYDEGGIRVDFGTKLRLVAFAPKVRISGINSATEDGKAYFFNAVRADQADFWEHYHGAHKDKPEGKRIRASFCTIRKVKA